MADLACCSTPKKMKLEADFVDDFSNEGVTDLSTYVTNLRPVLADEYTNSVQFETVIACEVRNKKYLSHIIKELSVHLPVPRLQHLKRVKKIQRSTGHSLSVFLCPLDEKLTSVCSSDSPSQMPSLRELCPAIDLPDDAVGETFTVLAPSHAPLTRQQYDEASAVWPTTFHEDKHITRILSGNVLNDEELKEAELNMKTAIRMAEAGRHSQQKCVGCSDGCAIVDPLSKTLLAAAHPVTKQHPLHHSIMVAIDLIARRQGGGSYKYEGADLYVAETRQPFIHSTQSGPYLCTGYDVYVTTEPCIMCSMALIHSRIRRLYYGNSSPDGALGTKYKLHVQPGLNHHFEVFRGLLEKRPESKELNST